jgi:transcriptional regulator with XRE-family HTH domain
MISSTRKLRDRLGLTQAELALLLGCAQGTVTHWEHGRDGSAATGRTPLGSSKLLLEWLENVDPDRWQFIRRQRSWSIRDIWTAILTSQRKDDDQ